MPNQEHSVDPIKECIRKIYYSNVATKKQNFLVLFARQFVNIYNDYKLA